MTQAFVRRRLVVLALLGISLIVLANVALQVSEVEQPSMEPSLQIGDVLLVNKLAYLSGRPRRGEIVIVRIEDRQFVKRVVGFPGETIEERGGNLYIDGRLQDARIIGVQPFAPRSCNTAGVPILPLYEELLEGGKAHPVVRSKVGRVEGLWRVPPGEFFVLGDNRDQSGDSRWSQNDPRSGLHVTMENIVGRAERILYTRDRCTHSVRFHRARPL